MQLDSQSVRRILRTIQVYLPEMRHLRPTLQRHLVFAARRPVEAEFKLLSCLDRESRGVIVDVGANRGLTVASARLFDRSHPIVAFEPNMELTEQWAQPGQDWHGSLVVHNCALGAREGHIEMHTPVYRHYRFDGLSSCREGEASGWLGPENLLFFQPDQLQVQTWSCPVHPLDRFDLHPLTIKIDVQGFEHEVLQGGLETIRAARPMIIAEIGQDGPAVEMLRELDYRPYRFEHDVLRKNEFGDLNTVFMHDAEVRHFAQFLAE